MNGWRTLTFSALRTACRLCIHCAGGSSGSNPGEPGESGSAISDGDGVGECRWLRISLRIETTSSRSESAASASKSMALHKRVGLCGGGRDGLSGGGGAGSRASGGPLLKTLLTGTPPSDPVDSLLNVTNFETCFGLPRVEILRACSPLCACAGDASPRRDPGWMAGRSGTNQRLALGCFPGATCSGSLSLARAASKLVLLQGNGRGLSAP